MTKPVKQKKERGLVEEIREWANRNSFKFGLPLPGGDMLVLDDLLAKFKEMDERKPKR